MKKRFIISSKSNELNINLKGLVHSLDIYKTYFLLRSWRTDTFLCQKYYLCDIEFVYTYRARKCKNAYILCTLKSVITMDLGLKNSTLQILSMDADETIW